jgi:hypothetical protein
MRWNKQCKTASSLVVTRKAPFRIVICTRDSDRWVGSFLNAYRELGLDPLYICDTRTRDRTRIVLESMGAETIEFQPYADYVEAGMVEFAARLAATQWVLRLDDDEFPSKALIQWLSTEGVHSRMQVVNCSRRDVFRRGGRYVYSRHPNKYFKVEIPGYLSPHHRFFKPDRVKYNNLLHSAGFMTPSIEGLAPEQAFFIHCNCLVRSFNERLDKLRRYEEIQPNSTWKMADAYLPEIFDSLSLRETDDGLAEFEQLFASLPRQAEDTQVDLPSEERAKIEAETARAEEVNRKRKEHHVALLAERAKLYRGNNIASCGGYEADLTEGILLRHPGMPSYLCEVTGLSTCEEWGRWTDGPFVEFRFAAPLPKRFLLELKARPFGPNKGRGIGVTIGRFTTSLRMFSDTERRYVVAVNGHGGADFIRLSVPAPTSPASLGISDDTRLLGLAITWLRVKPRRNRGILASPVHKLLKSWLVCSFKLGAQSRLIKRKRNPI